MAVGQPLRDRPAPRRTAAAPSSMTMVLRQVPYWLTLYRRTWRGTAVLSFVQPWLYVAAMGVLLGGYIDKTTTYLNGAPSYLDFIAPGLLAGTAMQVAVSEAMWPVMSAVRWDRTYHAMLATPLRVRDIMLGHLSYIFVRLVVTCLAFVLVLSIVGTFPFPGGAVLAVLAALVTGLALAAPVYAYSAGAESEQGFPLIYRLGVLPMFLLSGAFFPVWNLATPLEWLAKVTPLYHGVELCRMAALGEWRVMAVVHLTYLGVLGAVGIWWGIRRLQRRLGV